MKMSGVLLGLTCMAACTSPAGAWWWNSDPYTYRNYSTTTITVRPYNAFADTSCSMSVNGAIPLSLLGQCGGGGGSSCGGGSCGSCNGGSCCAPRMVPACSQCYPPCYSGWPSLYYGYPDCNCAHYPPMYYYPPSMYYPMTAYYPPPPVPQPKR